MIALYLLLATFLVVWLWLVWDMTREVRAGWTRGGGIKGGVRSTVKRGLRPGPKRETVPEPPPEPEPPPKPARDPRYWMDDD